MHRVLVPPSAVARDRVTVADPQALHHLLRVLRVKVGDRVECFDGRGHAYAGPVTHCDPRQLAVAIDERREEVPARPRLALAQGLIQPQRFDWLVQKSTELGVAEIIPLVTTRTTSQGARRGEAPRLVRWRRIAEEAAAQCGRATVPPVHPPQPFASLIEACRSRVAVMLTLTEPSPPLEQRVADLRDAADAIILIGPEGDFSPEEIARAKVAGVRTARLGGAVLRSETAAIAALAILQHRLGTL